MKCSIVVPCYNESKNIPLILSRFAEALQGEDVELILVNNGSSDDSAEVLARECAAHAFTRIVHVEKNQGYGHGVLTGLRAGKGEFLGWTHADMQTDPKDTLKALKVLESSENPEKTYVKGLRSGRPLFDQFFTTGMSLIETFYLGRFLWDINAQPNLFHRSFFASWKNPPHDFALDLYALYQASVNNLTVLRIPVVFPPRIHGQSSWNTGLASKWKFIRRTLDFSVRLKAELMHGT